MEEIKMINRYNYEGSYPNITRSLAWIDVYIKVKKWRIFTYWRFEGRLMSAKDGIEYMYSKPPETKFTIKDD